MTIVATVQIGSRQISNAWPLLEADLEPFVLVTTLKDDRGLIIPLDRALVTDTELASEKAYRGLAHISDAIVTNPFWDTTELRT